MPEHLVFHIESIHEGICNNCDQCEYESIRKSSLRIHIQSKREGICYKCDQCEHELIC